MSRARTLADYVARNADNKAGIIAFFSATTAPDGWLECNGAAVSRTTYAALFAALGTTYGVGDGSTTFNLPDLRGEFIRGWDNGRGVDTGRSFGAGQTHAMQTHTHDVDVATASGSTGAYLNYFAGAQEGASSFARSSWGSQSVAGANTAPETRPRNIAMLPCIKT
jgi:microcystin-dependent protein